MLSCTKPIAVGPSLALRPDDTVAKKALAEIAHPPEYRVCIKNPVCQVVPPWLSLI